MRIQTIPIAMFMAAILAVGTLSQAQTTQPVKLPLEYRANKAFNEGRYQVALSLLQELAGTLVDQPDKLNPVLERVRVCKRAMDSAQKMQAAINADPANAALKPPAPTAEARKVHETPKPGETLDLAIKDLGNFEFDAEHGGNIPDDVVKLNGCHFRTRGYMIPIDQAENIGKFALVPSLFSCCFGQPPQVQHTIVVTLPPGKAVSYFPEELQVEGTLVVKEMKDEGYIVGIFAIEATSVKPAPK